MHACVCVPACWYMVVFVCVSLYSECEHKVKGIGCNLYFKYCYISCLYLCSSCSLFLSFFSLSFLLSLSLFPFFLPSFFFLSCFPFPLWKSYPCSPSTFVPTATQLLRCQGGGRQQAPEGHLPGPGSLQAFLLDPSIHRWNLCGRHRVRWHRGPSVGGGTPG